MIITNIYFTADFLVQPRSTTKKNDCPKYLGARPPHFYCWRARGPTLSASYAYDLKQSFLPNVVIVKTRISYSLHKADLNIQIVYSYTNCPTFTCGVLSKNKVNLMTIKYPCGRKWKSLFEGQRLFEENDWIFRSCFLLIIFKVWCIVTE